MTKQQHPFEAWVNPWIVSHCDDSMDDYQITGEAWNAALDWIDREIGAALADPFARDIIAQIIRRGMIDGI